MIVFVVVLAGLGCGREPLSAAEVRRIAHEEAAREGASIRQQEEEDHRAIGLRIEGAVEGLQESEPLVDFTSPRLQECGHGFRVSAARYEPGHESIVVAGVIVNGNAIDCLSCAFSVEISGGSTAEVVLRSVRAGSGTRFAATVPIEDWQRRYIAPRGRVRFTSGTWQFRASN